MACRRIRAVPWRRTCGLSARGSPSSACRATRPTSIRPNSCGATSRGANWPTSARTTSARSSGRSARAFGAFDGRPRWRSRFSRQEDLTLLVVLVDHPSIGARELRGPGHDRAQHGLEIQGGTDRLTDLAERPKLVDRARQVVGPGLKLLEEAHVLNGNDRLVGEDLEHLDLTRRESPGLCPRDRDRAD